MCYSPDEMSRQAAQKLDAFHQQATHRRLSRSALSRSDLRAGWSPETRSAVRRAEVLYNLITAFFWISVGLPLPLTVVYMQARGIDLLQIGLLTSLFALTVAVLELPTGGLADAIGRKRVTVLAYIFLLVKDLVLLVAFSFPLFALTRLLNGMGRALSSGALDAWYIDRLHEVDAKIDIQPFLARAGTVSLFAIAVSTLFGGLIASLFPGLPAEGTAVFTPISMTIVAAVLVQGVNILLVAVFVKEEHPVNAGKGWGLREVPEIVRDALKLSFSNPVLLLILSGTAISGFAWAGVETFWQPRFAEFQGDETTNNVIFGALMTVGFLAGMVGSLLSIPITRLFRQRYALAAALFKGLSGVFLLLLAFQSTLSGTAAYFWLFYLGNSVTNSPLGKIQNDEIPKARRSSMLSVGSFVTYAGFFVGSVVLGFVADRASIGTAWAVAGALLIFSIVLYVRIDLIRLRRKRLLPPTRTA